MIWPANLSTIAFLRSLHDKEQDTADIVNVKKENGTILSRAKFFWLATIGMAIYQFFPSFLTPVLTSVSLLCYFFPNNHKALLLGSARNGLGLLSLSFDWSIITTMAPIITPLWALLNQYIGSRSLIKYMNLTYFYSVDIFMDYCAHFMEL